MHFDDLDRIEEDQWKLKKQIRNLIRLFFISQFIYLLIVIFYIYIPRMITEMGF